MLSLFRREAAAPLLSVRVPVAEPSRISTGICAFTCHRIYDAGKRTPDRAISLIDAASMARIGLYCVSYPLSE